jgi:hypothetical protein
VPGTCFIVVLNYFAHRKRNVKGDIKKPLLERLSGSVRLDRRETPSQGSRITSYMSLFDFMTILHMDMLLLIIKKVPDRGSVL